MRNNLLLVIMMLFFVSCTKEGDITLADFPNAQQQMVELSEAKALANSQLPGRELVLMDFSEMDKNPSDAILYYVFTAEDGGFVIVSAHRAAQPILGYSEECSIDPDNLPLGLADLLKSFSKEIGLAYAMNLSPSASIADLRSALRNGGNQSNIIVDPLLGKIKWNQGTGYNAFTPDYTPVGCVATATAMIMRYWKYPERGQGVYRYRSSRFGTQGHDYNYTLQWDKMQRNAQELNQMSETQKSEAVFHTSRFSYGVAVAVDMNFDYGENGGSGTYQALVPGMLTHFYKYPRTIKNIYAEEYTSEEWHNILQAELKAKRPVQYAGRGDGGGHSFVIDGYKDNGDYHLNWGWGGSSNGWFKLNALDPEELGEGGGTGGFNLDHEMIIGFEPPARVQGKNTDNVDILDPILFDRPTVLPSIDLYISHTLFNGVQTASIAGGYEDYTDKVIIAKNGKLDLRITPTFLRPDATGYMILSLDLDRDGRFTSKDKKDIVIPMSELRSGQVATATIDLMSYDAKPEIGKKYTMRINLSALGYSNPNYMISGEVEDYSIIIK